ncbi:hypothetical protein ACFRI7_31985 [Streptomyces sp. NPDC056716]|uniref:hypothetical protein n=1 Tax=unclassified Streptomyces TaxID=2593676 RepID=UPI003681DF48
MCRRVHVQVRCRHRERSRPPRPSWSPLAAWAANQLAREQLREAGRRQHRLITTLARTAAALARESGQPVSDTVLHEIEQTLHAVLARPDIAAL